MKKLILASSSPQRRKLMEILGLPFAVLPSKAEEMTRITKDCSHLVKANALLKARDVARRVSRGIVIGADTVVYSSRDRLILKPKDLKEAGKNLKELMAAPHWVYSGVAVIDAATGRKLVECEKTRVFMTKLSDKSIRRYHQLVPPLDKAGGFDIEGKGGLFIPRIEGCYFNVVGLPLAKLAAMLKKFGVHVLSALILVFTGAGRAHAAPEVCDHNDCVSVEVVSKQADLERGLMYRKGLEPDHGMLFVFNMDDRHSFWMKNMKFSLDMLWISFDGRIVYMAPDVPPCVQDPCPVYTPDEAARYVLEVSSGFAVDHHWKPGDVVNLKDVLEK